MNTTSHLDFGRINRLALQRFPELVAQWLPAGRREGAEWVALNPTRPDYGLGSFKINIASGKWADFATGDRGGDPISLLAYLLRIKQVEAALRLSVQLGGDHG